MDQSICCPKKKANGVVLILKSININVFLIYQTQHTMSHQQLIDKINQHIKTLIALEVASKSDIISPAIKSSMGIAKLDLLNEIKKEIDLIQSGPPYTGDANKEYQINSSLNVVD